MQIWSVEIKELETLYTSIKGRFPELEKELEQLIETKDANVVMLYSRRCLEVIITDLCESELQRPRKTEPLKGIIDKLNKEEKVPSHIITSMDHLNSLSTYGAHPKEFDPEQVKPVLNNLVTIIKWYLKYKETGKDIKAKPVEEIRHKINVTDDTKRNSLYQKKKLIGILSGLILLIVIVVLVLFLTKIIGGGRQTKELVKSIAVLPFRNDSPDSTNKYFIDGTMEAILDKLCKVADLTVISRTSVEQFRNTTMPVREIAKRLNVNYILEGSGQKYENNIHLTVQLIDAINDKHIWSSPYEGVADNIFKLQSQIAEAITSELKAIITPAEKLLIEKTPTAILNAYDLYLQAKNEHMKFLMDNSNIASLNKAMTLYRQTLQYDSTFSQAYSGIAIGYMNKYSTQANLGTNLVDSMIIYANRALRYYDRLDEAFYVKGNYYNIMGVYDRALKEFNEALEINPNYSLVYWSRSSLGFLKTFDIFDAFEDRLKCIQIEHGPLRPGMMRTLGGTFRNFGFPANGRYYFEQALKLDNDSTKYLITLALLEEYQNDSRFLELNDKVLKMDPFNLNALQRNLNCYERLGKYEDAYRTAKNIIQIWEQKGMSPQYGWDYIGYAFWKTGHLEEAKYYFDKQIQLGEKVLKLDPNDDEGRLVLAKAYAVLGEKEKALQFLNAVNDRTYLRINKGAICSVIHLYFLKYDPLLENLRNESTFQKMVMDYENVYNITHERFKVWLEQKGMLME